MAFSYSPKVVTNGLVLYLDEANSYSYISGSVDWNDLSRSQISGSLVNGPTFSSANGGSIVFDNTDDYATVLSSAFTFGTGDFTMDIWIKPLSFTTYGHMLSLPDQNTFTLKFDTVNDSPGGGMIYYYPNTNYGNTPLWKATVNTWYNITLARLSNVGYTYLNGTFTGTSGGFNHNITTQNLFIHKGWSNEYASSQMASIKIYNRALNATKVSQNFNALRGRFGI